MTDPAYAAACSARKPCVYCPEILALACRAFVATLVALSATGSYAEEPGLRIMQEPVFGLRYEVAKVKFDQLPSAVIASCPIYVDQYKDAQVWMYAVTRDAARTYYVIGAAFGHASTPGDLNYSIDTRGEVFFTEGTRCQTMESVQDVFDSRPPSDEISQATLRRLADDLLARYERAFGGPENLRTEWRNRHVDADRLPPILRSAFRRYLDP
ncbi:MAG: hypothetical protein V4582_10395 [Pseudomonadota bacterium]